MEHTEDIPGMLEVKETNGTVVRESIESPATNGTTTTNGLEVPSKFRRLALGIVRLSTNIKIEEVPKMEITNGTTTNGDAKPGK